MNGVQINEILDAFKNNDGIYKKAEVDAAISLKDEITPHLIRILENVLAHPETSAEDDNAFDHIYAFMLLGHFRETAAHRVIIDLFSLPDDMPGKLFGDLGTGYLPNILPATCGGSLEQIKKLAENRNANVYIRASALQALTYATAAGMADRMDILSYYESLFTGDEADRDSDFWSFMAMYAHDLHPIEIMDSIDRAYEQGLIFSGMIAPEDFKKAEARNSEECMERLKEEYEEFFGDIHDIMGRWSFFGGNAGSWEPTLSANPRQFNKPAKKKKADKKKRKMAKSSKRKNRR